MNSEILLKEIAFSKQSIKKLGSRLRSQFCQKNTIEDSDIDLLHDYRVWFKDPMSNIFKIVGDVSKDVYGGRVLTYRIKRIESIISKLEREPTMNLTTMGDIAGCRCIVKNEKQVYKIVDELKKKLHVVDEKDYIKRPRPSGYKSYHLIIKVPLDWRTIEIQIRTDYNHNWATLLEITDLLYEVKVKEGAEHKNLERFHLLRSFDKITIPHKVEFLEIEQNLRVYEKLTKIIGSNFLNIRSEWFQMRHNSNDKYYIFEVDKDKKTSISSFESFSEAEYLYLNKFKNSGSNVVLTCIENPTFYNVSKAYSNYTFMRHHFEDDFFKMIIDVFKHWQKTKGNKKRSQMYISYLEEIFILEATLLEEVINNVDESKISDKAKIKEWISELLERIKKRKELIGELNKLVPKSFWDKMLS